MNDLRDIAPVELTQLKQGLTQLELRRRHMRMYMWLSAILTFVTLVTIFFNQKLVYAFFDIYTVIPQLHVPFTAHSINEYIGHSPNVFGEFFSWVFWLVLNSIISVIAASILIHYARKLSFFKQRLAHFLKRSLIWLLSVVVIWIGLTSVQAVIRADQAEHEQYSEFIAYNSQIEQSKIYQYLQDSTIDNTVKNYLLAQTVLLHQPDDKDTALAYTAKLVQAEKQDRHFIEYGFKPEQLWTMQHQVYGKAVTPLAQSIQTKVSNAQQLAGYSQWLLIGILAVSASFSLIFYLLTAQFNRRIDRISNRLN